MKTCKKCIGQPDQHSDWTLTASMTQQFGSLLLKMFTSLLHGCEGEAVNRKSDLSPNPDLLQNWTMGDYEADYCGLDLLG